jgi:hypothetical protein
MHAAYAQRGLTPANSFWLFLTRSVSVARLCQNCTAGQLTSALQFASLIVAKKVTRPLDEG